MSSAYYQKGLIIQPDQTIDVSPITIDEMHEQNISHLHAAIILTRERLGSVTQVLLGQRANNKKQFPGFWCFPAAGHCIEEDNINNAIEADLVGLQRETHEELGLEIKKLRQASFTNCMAVIMHDCRRKSIIARGKNLWRHELGDLIAKNEDNPYSEQPIFTVGHLEIVHGDMVFPKPNKDSEMKTFNWVDLHDLHHYKLTPWIKRFISRIMPISLQ